MKSSSSPLFSQTLYYNDSYGSNTPRYNGNISAMSWTTSGDKTRGYNFAYDNLSRLTTAGYLEGGVANTSYSTSYAYDKHGNMTNLIRNGRTGTSTFGTVDNLNMNYAGNQLIKADDAGTSVTLSASMDFKNNFTAAKEYFYDLNGNLTQDLNKGITGITYNFLNLPQSVAISNTLGQATNTYMYAADGRKLRTVQQWSGTNSKQTDYVGNVIYESVNGTATTLKRILVDGGYIEGGAYYFYLTDHLGNNRVVANANGGIVQTNHYYPFGMSFAEGVTTSQQPYKYNAKELDTERGLNLYDYSARLMDPVLGRFSTVDPLAEKYPSTSPYFYALNNPLRFIDPDGRDVWEINNKGEIVNRIEDKTQDAFYMVAKDADGNYQRTFTADSDGNRNYNSISFEYGTIVQSSTVRDYDKYSVSGNENGTKLFEFMADNTKVEWGHIQYYSDNSTITTSHGESSLTGNVRELIDNYQFGVKSVAHSHPGGTPYPSGLDKRNADIGVAQLVENRYGSVNSYVYLPGLDKHVRETYIPYNSGSQYFDFRGHPLNNMLPTLIITAPKKKK
jgi:RHS repeat-associated protein